MDKALTWLALQRVHGVGNHLYKRLIERFGNAAAVLDASVDELVTVNGISAQLAGRIRRQRVSKTVREECARTTAMGFGLMVMADRSYPALLNEIPDPPPFLYVHGGIPEGSPCLAIVGSRNATPYGITMTRRLAADLSARGFTIVSGMARGIDTAAHAGALDAGGTTVAVLGSGLGRVYPAENRSLFDRIAASGAVISEFPITAEPDAHNFPRRNRIISGMSLGTVVVEATKKSGSLITARIAAEQNREVFAVPGSVHSFKSTGTHALIREGAKLVEHAGDIVEELEPLLEGNRLSGSHRSVGIDSQPAHSGKDLSQLELPEVELSGDERKVYDALYQEPLHVDRLQRLLNLPPGRLAALLLNLELKGLVQCMPGQFFSIVRMQ